MRWIRLKRGKIKVYGKQGKLLPKGMAEEHTAFLHNLLSNDIRGMKENTLTYNLWLRQNGFPIGEFYVYKLADHYLLDTPLDVSHVIEEFNRLKLSMRVYFETLDMEHIFLFGEGVREFIRERFGVELGDFEVKSLDNMLLTRNPIRLREEGYEIIGQVSELPLDTKDMLSEEEYEDIRIQRLIPKLGKELREGFSPLEACILKEAISLTKGCYVGQEAIARVYYRGRPARALALLEGEGLREGEKIRTENKDIGIITSVSPRSSLALGYLLRAKVEEQKDFETSEGKRVRVLKLCEESKG
ncbi:folate-binding protein [Hydrogenobacter sp. T-2]|uniref:CAF17-like 4Fe-4S cluster assembly/insertion protein YgfZ n=1 Tax=Pampinifervens diazotrophicum TaxID=1632018 RepID=UPI002B25E909|nr:folate-binding protein [Hydrogenobacter sp. T-2]WPM32061.1 folate-binding protein [Hydrogenobacter sp. T-2]